MNYPGKVIIDEVQYAPNLFRYIKIDVDDSNEFGVEYFEAVDETIFYGPKLDVKLRLAFCA